MPDNKPCVVITFDDGYKNNYTNAYPILKKYNIPAIIFLTTNFIDSKNETFMNWEQVKEIHKDNLITFGAHSQFHCNLKALDEEDLFDQIVGSKNIIENILSTKVDFFAYPGGGYTKKVLDIVGSNFKGGVKDRLNGDYDTDPFKLARVNIDNQIKNFKDFLILLISTKYLKNK